jgi:acetyl esterase/lipase
MKQIMKRKKLIPIVLLCLCAGSGQAIEPLKEDVAYTQHLAQRVMALGDTNRDGKFEEQENAALWEKNKQYDKNKDGAIDAAEISRYSLKYVSSKGRQLHNVLFKRVEGKGVYLDFYFPDVDDSNRKPVVVYTHGGGWAAGSKNGAGNASFDKVHVALLKQGFCVVSVGYRLVKKEQGTAMRDCVIDSKDAIRFISAHKDALGIDPNRIYTFGDSAGGHLAQMLLFAPPDNLPGDPELAKYSYKTVAGVSWYGPCDFEDEQLFNHDDRAKFRDRFGPRILGENSKPEEKLKLYREMSPINYLTKESPPLLMMQGDKDTTIPVKHAYHMQKKVEELNAPVEFLIVKNAGHNWRSVDAPIEPSREEIIQRTIQFFMDHK